MLIRPINSQDIPACVELIRGSFLTVAKDFGITLQNAPRFTAFAISEERLRWQLLEEGRPMFCGFLGETLAGYYSLSPSSPGVWELNNLCVKPEYRSQGTGAALLAHAEKTARILAGPKAGKIKLTLSFVEENTRLRTWYESFGFVHTETRKFDFFPFTCGYMEKNLISMKEPI